MRAFAASPRRTAELPRAVVAVVSRDGVDVVRLGVVGDLAHPVARGLHARGRQRHGDGGRIDGVVEPRSDLHLIRPAVQHECPVQVELYRQRWWYPAPARLPRGSRDVGGHRGCGAADGGVGVSGASDDGAGRPVRVRDDGPVVRVEALPYLWRPSAVGVASPTHEAPRISRCSWRGCCRCLPPMSAVAAAPFPTTPPRGATA